MGKLANQELRKILDYIRKDKRVLIPPMIGYDAGVHRLGELYVVVSTDPCVGVPEDWFGWLSINYAASDVALFGAKPQFCTINLLGPKATDPRCFQKIMEQTCRAADELDIAIVRGHTGMYDSLKDLLSVCTVYGTVEKEKLITPGDAKAGDLILCTKPLGFETITNYSLMHAESAKKLFGKKRQEEFTKLVRMQGCTIEALNLSEVEGVHAMHDATEGGFIAALNEIGEASKVGFTVNWEKIDIPLEVLTLQKQFGLTDEQLLAISSTGTILAAVAPTAQERVKDVLHNLGLSGYFIGEFTNTTERYLLKDNCFLPFPIQANDPYTDLMVTF